MDSGDFGTSNEFKVKEDQKEFRYNRKKFDSKTLKLFCESLSKSKKLETVSIVGGNLEKEFVDKVFPAFSKVETLKHLSLYCQHMNTQSLKNLFGHVNQSLGLESLNFYFSERAAFLFESEQIKIYCDFLRENKTIKVIDLSHIDFSQQKQILETLESNQTIEEITGLLIEKEIIQGLQVLFERNQLIDKLELLGDMREYPSLGVFFESLQKSNTKLISLKINFSSDGDNKQIFKEIVEFMAGNQSLIEFSLTKVPFGKEGLEALLKALEGNKTLRKLNITRNGLDRGCGEVLERWLEKNDTLEEIKFGMYHVWISHSNHISKVTKERVKGKLKENRNSNILKKKAQITLLLAQKRKECIVSKLPRRVLIYLSNFLF